MSRAERRIVIHCPGVEKAADFFGYFRDVLHSTFDNNLEMLQRVIESDVEGPLVVELRDYHHASEESRLVLSSLTRIIEKAAAKTGNIRSEVT
ncbi:hypothetical protein [Turneriella parva]|uniref:Barstar (barnase inhibitor) domain-containing protein n=1 Tax=Turneriella parva (strain ATCC BAA-1111 / DSM 21527 / NCTC 11395 / H) TaxID=869212 RepID=I4BB19_TURPD|nr:hypothetical protein [Turneriella parva]AFM14476.1 hypothetical protein Turpa_3842 [Turneriella parva DSM 21527]